MRIFILTISLLISFYCVAAQADGLSLSAPAFLYHGAIPVVYTCDGKDASPELTWKDAPANTKSFAIILSDPGAPNGTWYHWVIFNLPAATKELKVGAADSLPAPTVTGKNSWGRNEYNGPCPPKGSTHSYVFTMYALDTGLNLTEDADSEAVLQAIKEHVLEETSLVGVYSR